MYFISLFSLFILLFVYSNYTQNNKLISYSKLISLINEQKISKIEVQNKKLTITTKKNDVVFCKVDSTDNLKQLIQTFNDKHDDKIELNYINLYWKDAIFMWIMKNFLFVIFLLLTLYLSLSLKFSNEDSAGIMSQILFVNESDNEISNANGNDSEKVYFDDIGGCYYAKQSIKEIIDFLKNKELYDSIGAIRPKGILLYGDPGTGKTMLAKAVATEADCKFLYASATDFDEMYVGVGAARIRALFAKAKKYKNCVIFIDEIDALGRRDQKFNHSNAQTLNELLTQMDGFKSNLNIIVIGATNLINSLDPALIRSGRFDKKINISLPNKKERVDILERIIRKRNLKLDPEIDIDYLSLLLVGCSGADMSVVLNEAAMCAVRNRANAITFKHIDYALDILLLGENKDHNMTESEMIATARHESAHTLIAYSFPSMHDIYKVTILPRGKALGMLQYISKDQKHAHYKIEYINKIKCCLAGRAAEEIYYGDLNISSGASSDFEVATKIAREMVEKTGMSGILFSEDKEHISDNSKEKLDKLVYEILNSLYKETKDFLLENKHVLDHLSRTLYTKKTLTAKEVFEVLDKYPNLKHETPYKTLKYDNDLELLNEESTLLDDKNNV